MAGAVVGLPLVATSGNAQDATADDFADSGDPQRSGGGHRITLFFNLAHLGSAGMATDHYLYVAGRKHPLGRVADAPQVLARTRRRNAFLRDVDDRHITHHAVDVAVPPDQVLLAYLTCNENPEAGTWEMTGTYFHAPARSLAHAYREARKYAPTGPLPLSGKRRMYGTRAAMSLRDLQDEAALVDTTSFSEALVGSHPDVLSLEPTSFGHVDRNYVSPNGDTQLLGFLLQNMGPAVPAGTANVSGKRPWATLTPSINAATGRPYKKSDGKLDLYYPKWDPVIGQHTAPALAAIHPMARDDPSLGLDVTPYNLNNGTRPPDARGKLWARHDGVATVRQPVAAVASAGPTLAFRNQSAETGLVVSNPAMSFAPDGRIRITFDNISNWFLRWLGVWVQFYDEEGKTIPLGKLPADTYPGAPGPYPRIVDKDDWMFLGVVPPAFTLLGIPVQPGTFAPMLNLPDGHDQSPAAASVRIMYAGLGASGSDPQDVPFVVYVPGMLMTGAFNFGVVGLFTAVGVSNADATVKLAVSLGGGAVVQAVQSLVGTVVNQKDFVAGLTSFTIGFLRIIHDVGQKSVIGALADAIVGELALAEVIDSIPVAGQIAEAVAAVTGALQLAETAIEILVSPPAYVFECVLTHDLSVTFFSALGLTPPAPGYTLYYRVSYLFDNGTAHTQDAVTVTDTHLFPVTFSNIPYGGQVNIKIGIYMRANTTPPGQNDWLAGFGETGLTSNAVDQVASPPGQKGFPITATRIPITHQTRYVHRRKTWLDAQGQHYWQPDPDGRNAPPYTPPPGTQSPGLTAFKSITVRQEIAPHQAGYVGYSWEAYSSGVTGCGTAGNGQFDQMANLNTDAANAQGGYVTSQCGYNSGVRMGYSLLTQKSRNVYVDTNSRLVRPIELDPPAIASPASNRAFALLNNDSTRCLLHPSGHIVSINNAKHKIESLKLPPEALADSTVTQYYRARTFSGVGTQPGLVTHPIGLAITPDGVILVLEDAPNNRIQAFDLGGNPVPYFRNQDPPYYLEVPDGGDRIYLDLAVEFSGYLYLLSTDDDNAHRLDIFHPLQRGNRPIATTANVNAARIAVDYWRSLYALNYEVLRLPDGNIPGFTEPSVSVWTPTLT